MKDHFNDLISDDCDNLGDLLYGEKDDFISVFQNLESHVAKCFTDEIVRVELLDS